MLKPDSFVTQRRMQAYFAERVQPMIQAQTAALGQGQMEAFASGVQDVLERYHADHVAPLLERIAAIEGSLVLDPPPPAEIRNEDLPPVFRAAAEGGATKIVIDAPYGIPDNQAAGYTNVPGIYPGPRPDGA